MNFIQTAIPEVVMIEPTVHGDASLCENDKGRLLAYVRSSKPLRLELGCGDKRRDDQAITVDIIHSKDVDFVCDVMEFLVELPDGSVSSICSYHFLEHVDELDSLFKEIARVLKDDGHVLSVVPHFSNPFFYSDPTHSNFFGLYTFAYFSDASTKYFKRSIPAYSSVPGLFVENITLEFKSYRPRYILHAFKRGIGLIVNSCNFAKETYEELFCWIIPCYEIRCIMKKSNLVNNKT